MALVRKVTCPVRVTSITQRDTPETHEHQMVFELHEKGDRLVFSNREQAGVIGVSIALDDLGEVLSDLNLRLP